MYLAPRYYEYFPVAAFANHTVVQYSVLSNASVSTAFMTAAQFQDFSGSNGPVSNSISCQNGTKAERSVGVGPGSYMVLVYAYGGTANLTLSISVFPNNPLAYGPLAPPEPTGIASFGLTNESGTANPYAVASTDVIGLASISSLKALNSSAGLAGVNPSGVTLQLNSMLVVDEGGSRAQVYWCQNTPDFVTATSQVALADNVWNASASGFLSNDSITSQGGQGYVSTFQRNGTTQYFYAVEGQNSTYSLPLGLVLLMNATAKQGSGVVVQFGARMTGGVLGVPGTEWFDNITIHDPSVTGAYFLTDGNYSTPLSTYYDTELVFGGEGNGESTTFSSMAASLGLFYANGTGAIVSPFPSYFGFGQDTQEAAYNLKVSYLGNGEAGVSVGTPHYEYLGSASGAYTLASVESSLNFPGFTNGTTASTASTTSSAQTDQSTGGGIPEFPFEGAAVIGTAALVALSYLYFRRHPGRNNRTWRQGTGAQADEGVLPPMASFMIDATSSS